MPRSKRMPFTGSFAAGEVAPALYGRIDLAQNAAGMRSCINGIVLKQGGIVNRAGTEYVATVKDSTKPVRLISFRFNDSGDAYALEFGHQYIRFCRNGAQIVYPTGHPSAGSPVEVATPYDESELFEVDYAQLGDVMTFTHPSHDVQELVRYSHTSWLFQTATRAAAPSAPTALSAAPDWDTAGRKFDYYYVVSAVDENGIESPVSNIANTNATAGKFSTAGDHVDLTWTGPAGSIFPTADAGDYYTPELAADADTSDFGGGIATSSSGVQTQVWSFAPGTVASGTLTVEHNVTDDIGGDGQEVEYSTDGGANWLTSWTTGSSTSTTSKATATLTLVDQDMSKLKVRAQTTYGDEPLAVSGRVYQIHVNDAGINLYRVYKATAASGPFGYIGSTLTTSFTDDNIGPDFSTTPVEEDDPFDAANKYPTAVAYYQQRLCFLSTNDKPDSLWMSVSGRYDSFASASPPRADDAIEVRLSADRLNRGLYLVPMRALVALTAGSEMVISAAEGAVITPTNIFNSPDGYRGAERVKPVFVGKSALWVQRGGRTLRDLAYAFDSDGYTGSDLSIAAEHLLQDSGIVDMAYAQVPFSTVWCVRADGVLLGMTYEREHGMWAWHRHVTGPENADGTRRDKVESACSIPESGVDSTYLLVNRDIDGSNVRYVERMLPRYFGTDIRDAPFLDSSLLYDGRAATGVTIALTTATTWTEGSTITATASADSFVAGDVGKEIHVTTTDGTVIPLRITAFTSATAVDAEAHADVPTELQTGSHATWGIAVKTVTGLDHLDNETVGVLADGSQLEDGTVSGTGTLTIADYAVVVRVGLTYTTEIDPIAVDPYGGRRYRIGRVYALVHETRGLEAGEPGERFDEYRPDAPTLFGSLPSLESGWIEIPIEATWNLHGRVVLRQTEALPMQVMALVSDKGYGT